MAIQSVEIRQALAQTNLALEHLYNANDILDDAAGWGLVDIFGGNLVATLFKRKKMKEAQEELDEAQIAMENMMRELGDVEGFDMPVIETGKFLNVFDYLFDNSIVDLFVQNKIQKVRTDVREIIRKVEMVERRLEALR